MSKYFLDTWAWIEYFEGSEIGKTVDEKIKSEDKLFTSIVTLAELSDNFHRKDAITGYSWEEIREFVETKSEIVALTPRIASKAGEIKAEQRKDMKDFGLMDAMILESARQTEAKLISGDPHLKDKEKAEKIKQES